MKAFKIVLSGLALLLIQACSHPIEIVGEGDVTSQSGNRNCSLEQFNALDPVCSKNYVYGFDLDQLPAFVPEDYTETYYAVPRPGWHFARWEPYCTAATGPSYDCSFNATAAQVKAFWGATNVPPLKAVFVTQCGDGAVAGIEQCDDGNLNNGDGCEEACTLTPDADADGVADLTDNCPADPNTNQANFDNDTEGDVCDDDDDGDEIPDLSDPCPLDANALCGTGTPITTADTVTVNTKVWAQVDLFTNISWNQINAECPAGVCITGHVLNGHDMTGWTWAASGEVDALFNFYGVNPPLVGRSSKMEVGSSWAPGFFASGWRPLISGGISLVRGWMLDYTQFQSLGYRAGIIDVWNSLSDDSVWSNNPAVSSEVSSDVGAWFYRSSGTPITDTVTLNGKEWAQVDLFTNLSWNQINAACPNGVCTAGSVLKGHDMTGWTWASSADLIALYASFGISGGGDQSHSTLWYREYLECNDPFISGFGGWRATLNPALYTGGPLYSYLSGTVRDKYSAPWGDSNRTTLFDFPQYACENHPEYFPLGSYADSIDWDLVDDAYTSPNIGGFFYR